MTKSKGKKGANASSPNSQNAQSPAKAGKKRSGRGKRAAARGDGGLGLGTDAFDQTRASRGSVGAATSYSTQQATTAPIITGSRQTKRVIHRELLGSISGTTSATTPGVTKFVVQPGLAASFPWLSTEAVNWEQYRIRRMDYKFVTRQSTAYAGSLLLAADYDVTNPQPTTESQAATYENATEDSVWRDQCLRLDPSAMHGVNPRKYVRNSVQQDLKMYDAANIYFVTVGCADTTVLGKIWVEYEIDFFVPQTEAAAPVTAQFTSLFTKSTSTSCTTATPTTIQYNVIAQDPLGVGVGLAAGVFTPPAGVYKISASLAAIDTVGEAFTVTTSFLKNGAAFATWLEYGLAAASQYVLQFPEYVYFFNGTDTFQVQSTLTGAAGTLSLAASGTSVNMVMFSAA